MIETSLKEIINIPELQIEPCNGGCFLLEQDVGGNCDRVIVHRMHLRFMAEQFGLIESSDPTAARMIAKLERRLRLLQQRIDRIGEMLTNHPDRESADLDFEISYIAATADIADEFVADMEGA